MGIRPEKERRAVTAEADWLVDKFREENVRFLAEHPEIQSEANYEKVREQLREVLLTLAAQKYELTDC